MDELTSLIVIIVIIALAAPMSWAVGFVSDYQLSLDWEKRREKLFWRFVIGFIKLFAFFLILAIVNMLFKVFGIIP